MQLFPLSGPLGLVAVDILGRSTDEEKIREQFHRCYGGCAQPDDKAITCAKVLAPIVGTVLKERWILPFGIPNTILTDNGVQFVSKFFAALLCVLCESNWSQQPSTIRNRTDKSKDFTIRWSCNCYATSMTMKRTETSLCNQSPMVTVPKYIALQKS